MSEQIHYDVQQHGPHVVAAEFKMKSCGGDLLGATWHQLRVYQSLMRASKEIKRLRADVQRLTKQRDHYMHVASDLVSEEVAHQNGLSNEVSDE